MKKLAMKKLLPALFCFFVAGAWAAGFSPLDKPGARHLVQIAGHGRPTIVALWSSDCGHCKRNLGMLAALAKKEKGLRLVSVATEPESPQHQPLLDRIGLPGERYAYGSDAPEALAYALDPAWRGELPRTLLFDGKGGRQAISGVLDEARVRKALGL